MEFRNSNFKPHTLNAKVWDRAGKFRIDKVMDPGGHEQLQPPASVSMQCDLISGVGFGTSVFGFRVSGPGFQV